MNIDLPLCVDLDGTLVHTDTLYESVLLLLKHQPLYLFLLPLWLLRGRAYLKSCIAEHVRPDPALLPYNQSLLAFLRDQHQQGRRLILATAAQQQVARDVADHLGIFSAVYASGGATNLKGVHKARHLREQEGAFIYAGDSHADLAVWREAEAAVVVNAAPALTAKARDCCQIWQTFPSGGKPRWRSILKAIRPYQWVKNILLFLPLLAAHKITDMMLVAQTFAAFMAFSFAASSAYLLNDLMDLEADRHHHRKKTRPFAAGDLPLQTGLLLVPLFLGVAVAISLALPAAFTGILLAYYVLTLAYSFYFKRVVVLVDVVCLAMLYTLRVIAGTVVGALLLSSWLLAFSLFLFLCLAFIKRHSELYTLRQQQRQTAKGRGYVADDLEILAAMGTAAGYLAVLVLALYINSPEVVLLYQTPELLWLMDVLLLYWISRVWLIAHRGLMHDDPIVFALRDKVSHLVLALTAGVVLLAAYM